MSRTLLNMIEKLEDTAKIRGEMPADLLERNPDVARRMLKAGFSPAAVVRVLDTLDSVEASLGAPSPPPEPERHDDAPDPAPDPLAWALDGLEIPAGSDGVGGRTDPDAPPPGELLAALLQRDEPVGAGRPVGTHAEPPAAQADPYTILGLPT